MLTRLRGSSDDPAPTFVDLLQGRPLVRNSARPGFLGPSFKPFRPDISKIFPRPLEVGMVKELAALGNNHTTSLALNDTLDAKRLGDRANLLSELDRVKCELDASGNMEALDRFHQQAASILTSGRFADALDLSKIAPHELKRYTAPASSVERFVTADDHRSCLLYTSPSPRD